MNADVSPNVNADLAFGAKISNVIPIGWIVMIFGLISVLGCLFLMCRGFRRAGSPRDRVVDLRGDAPPIEVPPLVTPQLDKKPATKL